MTIRKISIRQHVEPTRLAYRRDRDGCDDVWDIYEVSDGTVLASIPFWGCDAAWMADSEAMARLFVAAPELLDALQNILLAGPNGKVKHKAAFNQARMAVAKAVGRK